MVDRSNLDVLAKNLARLLAQMVELHGELATLMRGKLDAVRRADSDRMQSITAREQMLTERVVEREGLRRQITRHIIEGLGLDPAEHAGIRLTDLAEYLPEPRRSQLLVAAAGLKDKLAEIERIRVTTTLVTQEMLKHMEEVFAVMTAGPAADVYSRSGRPAKPGSANVFEAVG